MMARTHMVGGLTGGLVWCAVKPPESIPEATIMLGGTVVGSLMPDLDHTQSKITKSNIITATISRIITIPEWGKHRRFWHSIWACLIFGAVFFILTGLCGNGVAYLMGQMGYHVNFDLSQYAFLVGFSIAWGSFWHLLLDACTIEGWNPLWRPKFRICLLPIHTSSPLETVFRVALIFATLMFAAGLAKFGVFDNVMDFDLNIPKL